MTGGTSPVTEPIRPPRPRRALFIFGALGSGVLAGIVGMELLLRMFRVLDYPPSLIQPDVERGWVLRPGLHAETPYAKDLHINSRGLRDREYATPKPPDRVRVLMLGDSITFGSGVRSSDSLPKQLERELANPAVEVINAGVPGYNTRQEYLLLVDLAPVYEPDIVLVDFFHNDLEQIRLPRSGRFIRLKSRVRRSVHAYTFFQEKYRRARACVSARGGSAYADAPEDAWAVPYGDLVRVIDFCGKADIGIGVVYVGLQHEPVVHARVRDWCSAEGVPYLSLHNEYAGRDLATLALSPRDGHPNAEAHAIAARAIARFLRTTPALRVRLQGTADARVHV